MEKKFNKILIANRGEIAIRIIRACHELGIKTVAIYSLADKDSLVTKLANEKICIGNSTNVQSYLNSYSIISAALLKEVDAIHPGIGYFAEDYEFSELCHKCGIKFIGPNHTIMKKMANKIEARKIATQCSIPVVEGSDETINSLEECISYVEKIGLPVIIKATNGGGGKGIRIARSMDEVKVNFELCKKEALAALNNSEMLIERYVEGVKHVEVQVLADIYGNIIHLGERECSIQRSNQKLIEEARCCNIKDETREKLYRDSINLSKKIGYVGPGTVEFLVLPNGEYYFMEMNTRLQVEHTITENITGIDLVKEQIRIFEGIPLSYEQKDITFKGYSLECRIISEDAKENFRASCGKITKWNMPGGIGVRIDSGVRAEDFITPFYDSLIAKISCFAQNKEDAVTKMINCLNEIEIEGIKTNVEFLKSLLEDECFISGNYNTNFVKEFITNHFSFQNFT